jgi:phosphoglycolate phosphatase-like HAD superfamily hydrolase
MQIWLFDIDGTLIDSNGAGRNAMAGAAAIEFDTSADIGSVEFSGRTDQRITRELFSIHGANWSAELVRQFHDRYLGLLPDSLQRSQGRVLPGVSEWLGIINDSPGARLGLITGNIRRAAEMKLRHFGLEHYFQFGGFGDLHIDRDDVAAEATKAAEAQFKLAVSEHELWVVGDTPHDIACARSIDASVIAVATGGHPMEELVEFGPDILLADLSDIDVVRSLLFGR